MAPMYAWIAAIACALTMAASAAEDERSTERSRMVELVARQIEEWQGEPASPATLRAMQAVARHHFVPASEQQQAYQNRPLPIGHGQTISQPFIVGLMTDLVAPAPGRRVLEIGTGSGYQAAILAAAGAEVHTIEIIEPLGTQAAERLASAGYDNVTTRIGDGYHGWAEHAPYDAIVVTAAAEHVPPPLVAQLAPGGRMVIPVGPPFQVQQLLQIDKAADGDITTRQLMPVRFVPLTGNR